MPKGYYRTDRIAEQIQRELAQLLRLELKDPRIGMITLTGVDVTRDYSHAKVFYTTLGRERKAAQEGLEHASGFLRSQLAHAMKLRVMPQLHFIYDPSIEYGARLSRLIDQAVADDQLSQDASSSESPGSLSDHDKPDVTCVLQKKQK